MSVRKGFSVVEVLIAFTIFSLIAASMTSAYVLFSQIHPAAGDRTRAVFLAEEGIEAARSISDENFSNLIDGTYGLSTSTNVWTFLGSNDTSGIYTRTVNVSTIDSDTKKVESSVTWQDFRHQTSTVALATYFTYWDKLINVNRFWVNATTSAYMDLAGTDNGIKVQILGNYAYAIRTAGTTRFHVIDISNQASPVLTNAHSLSNGSPINIFTLGSYAYVVGSQNNPEFQIVDISNPVNTAVVGSYNAAGNADAYGVYVVGTYAYMTRLNSSDPEFYILNVANPISPTLTGSLNLNGNAREVAISGNYAYIASTDDSQELQIVNVSNPAAPTLVGSLNLSGTTDAFTVAVFGATALIGQGNNLRIINVSNPAAPTLVSSLDLGGLINDIAINLANSDKYIFAATSNGAAEFSVVDITNTTTPAILKSINTLGSLNGIAYDSALDTSVAVSIDDAQEVLIFIPQ